MSSFSPVKYSGFTSLLELIFIFLSAIASLRASSDIESSPLKSAIVRAKRIIFICTRLLSPCLIERLCKYCYCWCVRGLLAINCSKETLPLQISFPYRLYCRSLAAITRFFTSSDDSFPLKS